MAVGRGVATPGSGNTESGEVVACREKGEERHEKSIHITLDIPSAHLNQSMLYKRGVTHNSHLGP